jgi:hypothetical protein
MDVMMAWKFSGQSDQGTVVSGAADADDFGTEKMFNSFNAGVVAERRRCYVNRCPFNMLSDRWLPDRFSV